MIRDATTKRRLGTVLTTLHTQYEEEIKQLLNIPASVVAAAIRSPRWCFT